MIFSPTIVSLSCMNNGLLHFMQVLHYYELQPNIAHIMNSKLLLKVLTKYYPQVMVTSPSIGRQGKALRRQQQRRILESKTCQVENKNFLLAEKHSNTQGHPTIEPAGAGKGKS